ncbi:MAG: hypothetical protein KF708_16180 [Pirellulales bacterium]|nr:hypothetical protein [Pirellulales bacterium]
MKMSIVAALATLLAIAISLPARAGESVTNSTWEAQQAQIQQLENELAALKARLDSTSGVKPASYVTYDAAAVTNSTSTSGFSTANEGCASCGNGGCGCGDCDFGCHPSGFYAGGAAVWYRPFFEDNIAISRSTIVGPDLVTESTSFHYDYQATPRVWLGYVADGGLGIRGQYWQYDDQAKPVALGDANAQTILNVSANNAPNTIGFAQSTGDGNAMVANHSLKLEIADLEVTKRIYGGFTTMTFSGGARYVQMEQDFRVSNFLANGQLAGLFGHRLQYEGVGPTVALDLRRPIGWSPLSIIGGARGSILFGNTDQLIVTQLPGTVGVGIRSEDEVMSILETQFGLEWAYHIAANGRFFVSGVIEAQLWQNAGSASLDTGDLGLIGFGFNAGLAR